LNKLKIHAIIIALNEEDFIAETIKPIYQFCTGISVVSQYNRDYYGKILQPDSTLQKVLDFPDPDGKIHLVIRKYNDETASRNHEMAAILYDASRGILSHGVPIEQVKAFHSQPDYFLICDADEIFDVATFPLILDYLQKKTPNGMRISGYNYFFSWNRRQSREEYVHKHFGFVKAGIFFQQRRVLNWNESRLNNLFNKIGFNAIGSKLYNFIDCPWDVGMMHHAGYVRKNKGKLIEKMQKHSHLEAHTPDFLEQILSQKLEFVTTKSLPYNIQNGNWPLEFFENIK
jgi:hypothetical protein